MREISKKFSVKIEEVIKTNRRFKELVHHQQNEQYETVILSNTTKYCILNCRLLCRIWFVRRKRNLCWWYKNNT